MTVSTLFAASNDGATRANSSVQALPTRSTGLRPRASAARHPTSTKPAKNTTATSCMPRYCCCVNPSVVVPYDSDQVPST